MHTLAETLGMTVTQIKENMPYSEYHDWILFFNWKQEQQNRDDKNLLNSPEAMLKGFGL